MQANGGIAPEERPHAASVQDMFNKNKWFFRHGRERLEAGISPIDSRAVLAWHRKVCTECTECEQCDRAKALVGLIDFGWDPVFDPEVTANSEIEARALVDGNYKKVDIFERAARKAMGKYEACGSAHRLPAHRTSTFTTGANIYVKVEALLGPDGLVVEEEFIGILTPMNAILKSSDVASARVLTKDGDVSYGVWLARQENKGKDIEDYLAVYADRPGVNITKGEEFLERANEQLLARGLPEIKVRLSTDCSITGVNDRVKVPSFSMITPFDAARLIKRNCWLAKGDLDNYFPQFPLAKRAWPFFVVYFAAIFYVLRCCCFGVAACPYYCSMWSAEYKEWLVVGCGLSVAHFVDDFLTNGSTREEAEMNLATMVKVAEDVGLKMPQPKREVAQRMVFLGLLFDTVKMVVSLDRIKAKAMALTLKEYLTIFEANEWRLKLKDVHTVAGKLGFMSEVLQEGRLHTRSWWRYLKHGHRLWRPVKDRLIEDTQWWIGVLERWERDEASGHEYPIYTCEELLASPDRLVLLQADASGLSDHGFGYFKSSFTEEEMESSGQWYAHKWDEHYQFGGKSHTGEFMALLHFLREADSTDALIVFVTDSQASFWSLNKGTCADAETLETFREILRLADSKHKQGEALRKVRGYSEYRLAERDSGESLHEKTKQAISDKPYRKRQDAIMRRYQAYCEKNGWHQLSFTGLSVARFLCKYVADCNGSTKSVDNVLSMLKGGCRALKCKWLSDDDYKDVKDMVKQLEYEDRTETKRKRAIRTFDLLRMAKGWNLGKRKDLQEASMYSMPQQGLLRSGELMSGLSTKHITWTGNGNDFDLELDRTKTLLKGSSTSISYEKIEEEQIMFAGDYLRKWYDMNDLWNKPNALLFPSSHKTAEGKEQTWSRQWFRNQVKRSVARIGLSASQYSGHSFRADGATELFVRGVPYHVIKLYGRWKSDAAMLYYRDPNNANRIVGRAFGVAERQVAGRWKDRVSRG